MMRSPLARTTLAFVVLIPVGLALVGPRSSPAEDEPGPTEPHRSPIALAVSPDGSRLLTANQTAGTVALVDPESGRVLDEVATGERPAGIAFGPDGQRAAVAHWSGYDLAVLDVGPEQLRVVGRVEVGPEPRGVAIGKDGKTAYVAVGVANEVVRVDLDDRKVTGRLEVDREPRSVALSPDGSKLLVSNARGGTLSVIDVAGWSVERSMPVNGANLRQVATGPEGTWGYVANMHNRGFATTKNNIDKGWVLGQRITRVPLDGSDAYQTLSLDPQGQAAADAHGVAVSADGKYLAVSLGGTHELMIFRTDRDRLPWRSDGSRDLIAPELLREDGRFRRVALGGRPTELAFAPDGRTLYVANYLADAVQVVDAEEGRLIRTIAAGQP